MLDSKESLHRTSLICHLHLVKLGSIDRLRKVRFRPQGMVTQKVSLICEEQYGLAAEI